MKKLTGISLFIFFCVVSAILTAGLVFYPNKKNDNPNGGVVNQSDLKKTLAGVSLLDYKEIAKHNITTDCWMIINNKVYNLSGYASKHPGGSRNITNYCGKEATDVFNSNHNFNAKKILSTFYIGDFVK